MELDHFDYSRNKYRFTPIGMAIGAVLGTMIGFSNAGIGGAIVGILIGGFAGGMCAILIAAALSFLPLIGLLLLAVGFIWFIVATWGVGKPS